MFNNEINSLVKEYLKSWCFEDEKELRFFVEDDIIYVEIPRIISIKDGSLHPMFEKGKNSLIISQAIHLDEIKPNSQIPTYKEEYILDLALRLDYFNKYDSIEIDLDKIK